MRAGERPRKKALEMTDKTLNRLMNAALATGLPVWAFAEFQAEAGVWAYVLGAAVSLAAMIGVRLIADAIQRRDDQRVIDAIIAREGWQ